ncbi:cx9C motif-containing protein 4 [Drosophila busckii]|uniref:cx9C motif-containing protein 4 n=1 Tax=Drosophila busckii TaxID=30019 RepID=UPI00083F4FD2|nr:cx9C motif-containing protein 4 [Drosophila busckii]
MSKNKKDPCKPYACRIQACLSANDFQERRCAEELEQMRQCCLKWHKESLCCSGIDLNKTYITKKDDKDKGREPKECN